MDEKTKVGVYICECGINIGSVVNVAEVKEYAEKIPGVHVSRYYKYMCSDPGQNLIKDDIKEHGLDRVVVASCSPRMHEDTFRNATNEGGLNPYLFEMANIREHCSWIHSKQPKKATMKAKDLIRMAVAKAKLLEALQTKEVGVVPTAMVIGGGIAGIQAALSIADSGFKTYLVEKTPSLGGRMSQLDKTFPTLDCSACILTPKMVDVARHPNIELLTYSEVTEVGGFLGNYKVKVTKKPRYIIMDKCVGCGLCADACRLNGRIPNLFNLGGDKRAVPYVPFPQAVPLKYTIDGSRCLMVRTGKCGKYPLCEKACDADAIDFTQKPEEIELDIGTMVVATGFDLMDPDKKPEYGYSKYKNVMTGLEFERLVSSSGPTGGKLKLESGIPKKVVFIQCVGSRDTSEGGLAYCSRVCCMYTAKHAHLVHEKIPDADINIMYTDIRAFGKGYEEFYNRVKGEGINYVRRQLDDPISITPKNPGQDDGPLMVKSGDGEALEADLVILATAIVPKKDARDSIARVLKISQTESDFFLKAHIKLKPVESPTKGIFLAGCCHSPRDIPDTVSQANGAAAKAIMPLSRGKITLDPLTSQSNPNICDGCGMCITMCEYDAIKLIEHPEQATKIIAMVNEALCEGCGSCVGACPSGAMEQSGFRNDQVNNMIEECLAWWD